MFQQETLSSSHTDVIFFRKIRKFFKSDSEIFLTLKNGLEAGSCILQMFHMYVGMGEGGQDGKLNH